MKIIHHEIGRDLLYKVWHSDKENMIIYIYSDGGSIVFQNKIYPMKKGALCFIRSNTLHHTMPTAPENYDRSKIFLSDEAVNGLLKATVEDKGFYNLFIKNAVVFAEVPEKFRVDIESAFYEAKKNESSFAEGVNLFLKLMLYLRKHTSEQITLPSDPITRALDYINSNYHLPLSLDDVCRAAHISKYHFCRKFKDALGITPMEYLLDTRIAAAKTLISSENISINIVSEKCGFSSFSYFCRIFKNYTGQTPSAYKKVYKQ